MEEDTVLGMLWDMKSDTIGVNHQRVLDPVGRIPPTKRAVWSFTHSLYDPLGMLVAFTIQAKFFQTKFVRWQDLGMGLCPKRRQKR